MSRSMLNTVGGFFGVSDSAANNIQQWRDRAQKKVLDKEFGLSFKHSRTKQGKNQHKFLHDAEKMLSKIEIFQKAEEDLVEQTIGTHSDSETDTDDEISGNNAYTQSLKRALSRQSSHQFVVNEAFDTETDIDGDTSESESEDLNKAHALPKPSIQSASTGVGANRLSEISEELEDEQEDLNHDTEEINISAADVNVQDSDDLNLETLNTGSLKDIAKDPENRKIKQVSNEASGQQVLLNGEHSGVNDKDVHGVIRNEEDHDYEEIDTELNGHMPSGMSKQYHNLQFDLYSSHYGGVASSKPSANPNTETRKVPGKRVKIQEPNENQKIIFFDELSPSERKLLESGWDLQSQSLSSKQHGKHKVSRNTRSPKSQNTTDSEEIRINMKRNPLTDPSLPERWANTGQQANKKRLSLSVSAGLGPNDFVYGKEALNQYKVYREVERKVECQKLLDEMQTQLAEYDWKIRAVNEIIDLAKDYYINPQTQNAAKWRELKKVVRRSSSRHIGRTEVRRKLKLLPEYRPFFTYMIILAQVISFIVLVSMLGFTYIGVEPHLALESGIQTYVGMETVHKWTPPNIWIGPGQKQIIGSGALYAPCIRTDLSIQLMYSQGNYSVEETLGCCEVRARNVAGTTSQTECQHLTQSVGEWRSGVWCGSRGPEDSSVRHQLRPCCVGVKGQCRLLSHKHCLFLDGHFHQHGPEHCSQVNCLSKLCKPGNLQGTVDQPWIPASPHQWWRLPLSLLYHHGILHVTMVTVAQLVLMTQIEKTAGWLRMIIIYIVSGCAALLASACFSPYEAHVGGVGAVCGMLGVVHVELVQFWSIVKHPCKELAKLMIANFVLLFCGTLPYLNVFGIMTGFVVGALCGVVLLPYITFGKWQVPARVFLIVVSTALLLGIFVLLVHGFVKVQSFDSCEVCRLIDCVPYTEKMCDKKLWQEY